jgi:hypothetical protein
MKVNRYFGGIQAECLMLISCLVYSSTLEIEVKFSSETPVDLYRTTRCYISENSALQIVGFSQEMQEMNTLLGCNNASVSIITYAGHLVLA